MNWSRLEVIHRLTHRGLIVGLLHRLLRVRLLHIRGVGSVRGVGDFIDPGSYKIRRIGELLKTSVIAENLLKPILNILANLN